MLVKTEDSIAKVAAVDAKKATQRQQSDAVRQQINADKASVPATGVVTTHPEADIGQVGCAMHSTELISKLHKLNPNLHFEVARADANLMGVYRLHPQAIRPDGEHREFITRMQRGIMPEHHMFIPRFEDRPDPNQTGQMHSTPTVDDMIWGWRTVLARLIRVQAITQTQVDRYFGVPAGNNPRWQVAVTQ